MKERSMTAEPIDIARKKLEEFGRMVDRFQFNSQDMSESDTRAKLIDPLIKDVLGWAETEIIREKPVKDGYVDYTLATDIKHIHVEAKRVKPRFKLSAKRATRRLKLNRTHLLKNKDVAGEIEQAQGYFADLGTEYAILTNGSQYILFNTYVKGRSWRDGHALVWHDIDDVLSDFARFYLLLARDNVVSGTLYEHFSNEVSIARTLYTPLQFIHNPDAELVRNPFWDHISRAFTPILTDQPENGELQEEIIRECYVDSSIALESKNDISRLLQDLMPSYVRSAGGVDIELNGRGRGSFREIVPEDLKMTRAGTYVLTGGVGSGKTTFLRRYAEVDKHPYIEKYCVWLHVDFLEFGSEKIDNLGKEIETYVYNHVLEIIQSRYPSHMPMTGDALRELFFDEINTLKQTILFGIDEGSARFTEVVNAKVDDLRSDPRAFVSAMLRKVRKDGRALVFVLDNTDQHGEEFQRSVFLFAQKLSSDYLTLSIVSLREEKFFAAYRSGVFDAYGTRKFHIGSPDLVSVIKKRLRYGVKRYEKEATSLKVSAKERERVTRVAKALVSSTTDKNGNIVRFLASVSSGDMRLALKIYSDFMSSGNTDVVKIERILKKEGRYNAPFHEFAKSAILGSRRYYRSSLGRIINVFALSSSSAASHWTACRVLQRLAQSRHASSSHGEGFVQSSSSPWQKSPIPWISGL
jgi:hypothetical protein